VRLSSRFGGVFAICAVLMLVGAPTRVAAARELSCPLSGCALAAKARRKKKKKKKKKKKIQKKKIERERIRRIICYQILFIFIWVCFFFSRADTRKKKKCSCFFFFFFRFSANGGVAGVRALRVAGVLHGGRSVAVGRVAV
jgi:hypothetical protein